MSVPPAARLPYTFTPIRTERLLLRPMTLDDVDAVHAYQSRADVCEYLLFEPRDRDRVAELVAEHAERLTLGGDGDYLQIAVERAEDGAMLGDLYFTIRSLENRTAEVGWTFHPDHQGRGYATEGARALLALAFDTLGLHRVVAELDPRNAASVALCGRLGLRHEATYLEDLWFKGAWSDTGVYAMLEREWRELRQR